MGVESRPAEMQFDFERTIGFKSYQAFKNELCAAGCDCGESIVR